MDAGTEVPEELPLKTPPDFNLYLEGLKNL